MKIEKIPVIRIYPSSIILFNTFTTSPPRTENQLRTEENLSRGKYNGYMSPKTKSKVRKYISTWLEGVKRLKVRKGVKQLDKNPYITFVTLTLPSYQIDTDNEIKRKCLTPFIETLKRKYNVWHYFWRAESQENGNIHFHLIIDSYIHYMRLRDEWNKCINKLGYVDRFRDRHGHDNPNSTDIHSIQNLNNLEAYVIKYCCKEDGYREINGRIHGCSDRLKKATPYEQLIDNEAENIITEALNSNESKLIEGDGYTIIMCNSKKVIRNSSEITAKRMHEYYRNVITDLYRIEIDEVVKIIEEKRIIPEYKQAELPFYHK